MNGNITSYVDRIVVTTGVGRLRKQADFEKKLVPYLSLALAAITGQRPVQTVAKKSISEFRTRQGDTVGLKVTLRGKRMADFFTRLMRAVLPRVRDFRGLPLTAVDEHGNLNIGLQDQSVFPEINMEDAATDFGLQVTIVGRKQNRDEMLRVYREFGVPLEKKEQDNG